MTRDEAEKKMMAARDALNNTYGKGATIDASYELTALRHTVEIQQQVIGYLLESTVKRG